MAYQVIARKCRPQTFEEVVGQQHVTRTLQNALRQQRIGHAFLFTGERGVGKTSIARILAKALNCREGPTATPCGTCSACTEIAAGTSLDVHEIDGASHTGVDDIRSLRENIRYLPSRDRYKIYIIDEVHMLSTAAFNALLKTLEEPPAHAVFMFATTEPQKIPDTIISRCLRFDFTRIAFRDIAGHLAGIAAREAVEISPRGLALIAEESDGSMRDAQTLLERAIAYCGTQIEDRTLEELLGRIDRRLLLRVVQALLGEDATAVLTGLEEVYESGADLTQFYYGLLEVLRDMVVARSIAPATAVAQRSEEDLRELAALCADREVEELLRFFRILFAAEASVLRTRQPRMVIEVCLLEMLLSRQLVPVSEIIDRIDQVARGLPAVSAPPPAEPASSRAAAPRPAAPAPATPPAPPQDDAGGTGAGDAAGLVAFIAKQSVPTASKLRSAAVRFEGAGVVVIELPAESLFLESLQEPETRERITQWASTYCGREMQVRITTAKKKTAPAPETDRQTSRMEQALHNPVVQRVMETFQGTIVDVRTDS